MRRRARWVWSNLRPVSRVGVVVLGLALAGVLAVAVLAWAPEWLANDDLAGREKAEDVGRARTATLALLAGLIAIAGAVFTGLSYRLNRAGQITERFTRAVDQLGSEALDIRLGGIYALERIARDSSDDHPQVVEVLSAFVRERAPWPPAQAAASGPAHSTIEAIRALERIARGVEPERATGAEEAEDSAVGDDAQRRRPATDVQAAMTVLGRRDVSQDRLSRDRFQEDTRLDLANTDLRGVALRAGSFPRTDFRHAQLNRADFTRANLQGALLGAANLERARLVDVNLQDAFLHSANLEGANLAEANLERGTIIEANLDGANFRNANLRSANFNGATLRGAVLHEADFRNAKLIGANLDGADLLSQTRFDGAVYDEATTWPQGFNKDAAEIREFRLDALVDPPDV